MALKLARMGVSPAKAKSFVSTAKTLARAAGVGDAESFVKLRKLYNSFGVLQDMQLASLRRRAKELSAKGRARRRRV